MIRDASLAIGIVFALNSAVYAADGNAPRAVRVDHINDWAAQNHSTIADPNNSGIQRLLPNNFRRIDNFYFSAQPNPDRPSRRQPYDPSQDQWLTLKDLYQVYIDIDFRPSNEVGSNDINEDAQTIGYVEYLMAQWQTGMFELPYGGELNSGVFTLSIHSEFSVPDGHPLTPFGKLGSPFDFSLARNFLDLMAKNGCGVIIHCHEGQGRTGSAEALIAYGIYGVPMAYAINLSQPPNHNGWIDSWQEAFLMDFAKYNPPGYKWSSWNRSCQHQ